jgi:hypothetical protein
MTLLSHQASPEEYEQSQFEGGNVSQAKANARGSKERVSRDRSPEECIDGAKDHSMQRGCRNMKRYSTTTSTSSHTLLGTF